jgi:MYXO-CTERM domain-containing protein
MTVAFTCPSGGRPGLPAVVAASRLQMRSQRGGQSFSLYVVATPVPEPEGYALALAAAGVLAVVLRRRRIANATTPIPARAKP